MVKKVDHGLSTEQLNSALDAARWTPDLQADYEKKQGQIYNNWLNSPQALTEFLSGQNESLVMQIFSDGGKIKFQQNRVQSKQDICIIDYLNFTVNEESFNAENSVTDQELILESSRFIKSIFGFGISFQRPSGMYFYDRSYELGDGYGVLCHGGQNRTILVSLSGVGCSQASDGWQTRLYRFLELATIPKITRIDIAHDIFDAPRFTVDHYVNLYHKGGFSNSGRPPKISQAGQWLNADNDGRTLYIGRRTNGLFARIYEKGLQLESLDKPTWVRIEVEIKSVDRIIPLDVLLRPHDYFAGTYPAFRSFNNVFKRVDTISHEVSADVNHRFKWAKRQSGSFIRLAHELGLHPLVVHDMLISDQVPKPFRQKFLDNSKPSICEMQETQVVFSSIPVLDLKD